MLVAQHSTTLYSGYCVLKLTSASPSGHLDVYLLEDICLVAVAYMRVYYASPSSMWKILYVTIHYTGQFECVF